MAMPGGRPDPPVAKRLFDEGYRFNFFQAVRLLLRLYPDRVPVGREGPPSREVARFGAKPGLAFPPSAIHAVNPPPAPDVPAAVQVAFLGLTGPMGVLPRHYTELVQDRLARGDRTMAAFFDLFNHRLTSLFYRAWEKHHFLVPYERGEGDKFTGALLALIGLGTPPLRGRHDFADEALLFYAGFFAQGHHSAVALESLLRDLFGLSAEVHQFQGRWLRLAPGDRSRLGSSGPNNQMAVSLVVGNRVWDQQGKLRIRIGPLSFAQFRSYLPGAPAFRRIGQVVRLYVGPEFDFDLQVVLKAEEVPPCKLSAQPGGGAQLGRFAWLKSRPAGRDADEAIFEATG